MIYKNYIWDFDGTLYDTYEVMTNSFLEALQAFELCPSREEVYQWMKKESVRFASEHYVGKQKQELMDLYHEIEHKRQITPKPFSDTKETLRLLKERGGQHFVLTHRDETALHFLENDGLKKYFTDFITVNDHFPMKPSPDSILYLVEKWKLNKDETVMIGDRKLDVLAGKNAGVHTILYDIDGFLGEIPANHIVHRLRDILDMKSSV